MTDTPAPSVEVNREDRERFELRLLLEVSQAVAGTLDLDRVLQVISDGTARLLDVETAAIYLIEGGRMFLGATTPPLAPDVPDSLRWADVEDHPHLARAARTQQAVTLADMREADLSPAERAVMELRSLRSLLYLPFCHEGETIGVLILGTVSRSRVFSEHEIDLGRTLTNQLSLGVQNARLHAGLKAHAEELERQIAERARAERALRKSETRFRAVFEQAGDYVLLLAPEVGSPPRIVDANEAACEIHGYRREELLGAPITLLDPGQTPETMRSVQQRLERGEVVRFEAEHVRRDGSRFPVEVTLKLVRFEDGSALMISNERDITERRALAERLRTAQKMEAVGQLAGGVAHDFNNLLQVIRGFTDMAREQVGPGGEVEESLDYVLDASDRAASLVGQLLAFGRRQTLSLRSVDLGALVDQLMPMLRPLLGVQVEVASSVQDGLHPVSADPGQIEQILINLCLNARDAMRAGGALRLVLENTEVDEARAQKLALAAPGPHVRLSVADTGHGMDDETLERAFEPFFTTKGLGEGTGLGLASVYGLVKQHEGAIEVTSEVGRGTTVDIILPAAHHRASARAVLAAQQAVRGSETILVAEDHELVLRLARIQLERHGYRVVGARDGEEALRLLATRRDDIALAILDVRMPGLGGEAVFERLRERQDDLPIIFCSAYGASALSEHILRSRRVSVVPKPFSERALLEAVREALSGT